MNKWIFENPYLLFNDLDGDNYEIRDLTGGYTVHVVNHVTPDQDKKIASINKHLVEFKHLHKKTFISLFAMHPSTKIPASKRGFLLGGRPDLNRRPPEPQSGALTS